MRQTYVEITFSFATIQNSTLETLVGVIQSSQCPMRFLRQRNTNENGHILANSTPLPNHENCAGSLTGTRGRLFLGRRQQFWATGKRHIHLENDFLFKASLLLKSFIRQC